MSFKLRALLLMAAALALAGCGFHLAGTRALPPQLQLVYLDVSLPYSVSEPPLETALQRLLQRRGARLVDHPEPAATVIQLTDLSETREVLSIGTDGKALEYQLITTVKYAVFNNAKPLLPPGNLRLTRDYGFNAQQVLAKEAEEERLREFIQGELAEQLMLRIEAALSPRAVQPVDSVAPLTSGSAPPQ